MVTPMVTAMVTLMVTINSRWKKGPLCSGPKNHRSVGREAFAGFLVFGSALISSLKKGGRLSVRLVVKTCLRMVRVIVRRMRVSRLIEVLDAVI